MVLGGWQSSVLDCVISPNWRAAVRVDDRRPTRLEERVRTGHLRDARSRVRRGASCVLVWVCAKGASGPREGQKSTWLFSSA
jgi:hypothetical protein